MTSTGFKYRILREGEIIQAGDDFQTPSRAWWPAMHIGTKVKAGQKYRRAVDEYTAMLMPPAPFHVKDGAGMEVVIKCENREVADKIRKWLKIVSEL